MLGCVLSCVLGGVLGCVLGCGLSCGLMIQIQARVAMCGRIGPQCQHLLRLRQCLLSLISRRLGAVSASAAAIVGQ